MKLNLLVLIVLIRLDTFAQLNAEGDGYSVYYFDPTSQCLLNDSLPNNGGQLNTDQNTFKQEPFLTKNGLELKSVSDLSSIGDAIPCWFSLPVIEGDSCTSLEGIEKGVDISAPNTGFFSVSLQSNIKDAEFQLFLGGPGAVPVSSTYNTGYGEGVIASGKSSSENIVETFLFHIEGFNPSVWNGWNDKNNIRSVGFRSLTNNAIFTVADIKIGLAIVVDLVDEFGNPIFKVFPNPTTTVLNIEFDATSATTVQLIDLTGKVVASETAQAGSVTTSFATAGVNAGVYFVNVKNANGSTTQKVVIK